jgi:hypothetical protein
MSFFGPGAPLTPLMRREDEESVEELEEPVPSLTERETTAVSDPQGDIVGSNETRAGVEFQRKHEDIDKDWDLEILNHVLSKILGKDEVGPIATNPFTLFLMSQGIDDARLIMTMNEEDFQAMGFDIDFLTLRKIQALNMKYNEEVTESTPTSREIMWFFENNKTTVNRYLLRQRKVTKLPEDEKATAPSATPVFTRDSNKAKLEASRRSSLATFNLGKSPSAPTTPMSANPRTRVTFGGTTSIPSGVTTRTNPSTMGMPATATSTTNPSVAYVQSHALEFDKGGRRSSSDYAKFTSREQWSRWHRALMGSAFEHKCEQVLDPTYAPDPNDADECELFKSQQRFMYSVFSKTLMEGKSADILREYSDPRDKTKFGDAQKIYADLCDFFEGGAMTRVSAATLESKLTNMRLNKQWTKTVSTFVTTVSHLIRDHKEVTQGIHTDEYYIKNLNATFLEHKDMAAHIQTMETQDAMLLR